YFFFISSGQLRMSAGRRDAPSAVSTAMTKRPFGATSNPRVLATFSAGQVNKVRGTPTSMVAVSARIVTDMVRPDE
ncbi:MAG TPA: hypothetical protein VFT63_06390, partial [bacterium]|nr:hypothetical protein [bacterium]